MTTRVATVALLLSQVFGSLQAAEADRLLFSFETPEELRADQSTAAIAISKEHATNGKGSLEVKLDRPEAGFSLVPVHGAVDFRGAKKLLLDVYNSGGPSSLISRVYDAKGSVYVAWYYRLQPGENTVELDVFGMGKSVDLAQVSRLYFYVEQPAGPLFVDNVRLASEAIDLASKIRRPASHPSKEAAGNLLDNGDFELGMTGWDSWGEWDGGEYQFGSGSEENATSGEASLAIHCIRKGRGGVFTSPMLLRAGTYELRYWAKGDGPDAVMRTSLEGEGGMKVVENLGSPPIPLGETWKEYRFPVVLRVNAALRLYLFSVGTGTVYIDAAALTSTEKAADAAPVPVPAQAKRRVTTEGSRILLDGRPFFPIGIYHARPEALTGTGFNSIVATKLDRELLDACEAAKILVSPDLTGVMRGHLPWQAPAAIERFKNHPAIFGWYLCDEPDHAAWTVPPPEMRLASQYLRKADPLHPTWSVVMAWADSNMYQYADTVDILATDVYPIEESHRRPLVEVAQKTDVLRKAVDGRKPVILVTQASKLVRPVDEYALTYLAVTHGASGIYFWEFAEAQEDPEHWATLATITRELQALSPVLTSPESRPIQPSDARIHALSRRLGDRVYVITVNEGPEPVRGVSFSDEASTGQPIQVLFERRVVAPIGTTWRDDFGGYERHVYSIPAK